MFDVDGVLVDVACLLEPFYEACDELGVPRLSEQDFYGKLVGHRPRQRIQELLGLDPDTAGKLYERFREKYKEAAGDCPLLPGAKRVLETLEEQGCGIGIVTTKARDTATRILDSHGLPYHVLVTAEDVERVKPDPEPVLKALDALGVRPEEAVMVGDHEYDVRAANSAGVLPVGVLTGVGTRQVLEQAGAKIIIPSLLEFFSALEEMGWTTRTR